MTPSTGGRFALLLSVALLAGCDSITGLFEDDPEPDTDPVEEVATVDDQLLLALEFEQAIEDLEDTDPADVPTSGSADYSGVAGFTYGRDPGDVGDYDILADVTISADFEDNEVSGTFDNLNDRDGEDVEGALYLTEGEVDPARAWVEGNLIGTVGTGDAAALWNLELDGVLVGDNGEYIYGIANGTATNGGSETTDIFGDFAVEED